MKPPREVEIKLRISDPVALLERIRALGAVSKGRVFEQNTIYDTRHGDFRRVGRLLRLRVENPPGRKGHSRPLRAILTSKAPAPGAAESHYKEVLENETRLGNARGWPGKLRSLGFRPSFRYEKYRTAFVLPGLALDLDETPIGTFLELEGSPRAIDRASKALGFTKRDYIRATYGALYATECRHRGRRPGNMIFQ
jgi:adenylate cyclase class 2